MKRIRSILRGREGMTLVELVVGAGLLCLVIGIFSASLRPAAEVSRRTQELNSAELIADDLLETVRSKVETATDYIKCYDNGTDVTNKTGSSEGSAIEFGYETEQGYNAAELLTADGCEPTKIVIADKDSGEQPRVEKGYLVERYYKDGYSQDADGNPIARAMTKTYAEGFYMGLRAGLHFKIDEAKHTVTATVTIYRDKDLTDKIYSDSRSGVRRRHAEDLHGRFAARGARKGGGRSGRCQLPAAAVRG